MTEDEAKIAALKFGTEMAHATRRATIEECAKMAETYMQNWEQGEHTAPAAHAIRKLASAEIAQSIRSLTKAGKGE